MARKSATSTTPENPPDANAHECAKWIRPRRRISALILLVLMVALAPFVAPSPAMAAAASAVSAAPSAPAPAAATGTIGTGSVSGDILIPSFDKFTTVGCATGTTCEPPATPYHLLVLDAAQPRLVTLQSPLRADSVTANFAQHHAYRVSGLAPGRYKLLVVSTSTAGIVGAPLVDRAAFAGGAVVGGTPMSLLAALAAYSAAAPITVAAGSDTAGVNVMLPAMACDPLVVHPGADLSGPTLQRRWDGCDFRGVRLRHDEPFGSPATSTPASFYRANFAGADLSGADLRGAMFGANDFSGANLGGARFDSFALPGATYRNTICPDGTNSDAHAATCEGHIYPPPPPPPPATV